MRFRLGLGIGFGAGYYFGAKAGRERYHQLDRWLSKARQSGAVETAAEKAKAAAGIGTERAKDLAGKVRHHDEPPRATISADVGGNGASQSPSR